MKHICNASQEGRCKHGAGKCNHYGKHEVDRVVVGLIPSKPPGSLDSTNVSDVTKLCTEERFCEAQNEMVHCVEWIMFPNLENPIIISEDLAKEFVEWARDKSFCNSGQHICDRLAIEFEGQLKTKTAEIKEN